MSKIQEASLACAKCGETKPHTIRFFMPLRRRVPGAVGSVCRACNKARVADWKRRNKEGMLTQHRRWYVEVARPRYQKIAEERRRLYPYLVVAETLHKGMTQRARRNQLELSTFLTVQFLEAWLRSTPRCPCCGVTFRIEGARNGRAYRDSPSVDRFNPNVGYTLPNVELICFHCNNIKRHASVEDLECIARWMRRRRVAPIENAA